MGTFYDSAEGVRRVLAERGFAARKQFGQNFLIHRGARETLLAALDVPEGGEVWEIGPGLGAVTSALLAAGARVTAFEVDRGFCGLLRELFAAECGAGRLTVVEGDALKTLPARLAAASPGALPPERMFGNLPYNIAAQLIAGSAERGERFPRAVFTLQKEVAERMCAAPGAAGYSAFSVLCRWAYTVRRAADFPPPFFWPRPDVDSRAVLCLPAPGYPRCPDTRAFARITRQAFAARRKTIRNNLQALFGAETERALASCGIGGSARAETLSVEDFLALANYAAQPEAGASHQPPALLPAPRTKTPPRRAGSGGVAGGRSA